MTDDSAAPGTIQIEGYDIVRELGRGAMGVVYLACDRVLEREVAIKVIGEKTGEDATERFLREARAMARLAHPNVVTVHRAGVVDGEPYLVMELLRGRSLEAALETDGPLSPTRLLEVAIGAARGLAAAHARGIVHRDIKPSNLFEIDDGTVKVLDFGIAKVLPVSTVLTGENASSLSAAKAGNDTAPDAVARAWETDRDAMTAATAMPSIDAMANTREADSTPRTTSETRIGGTPLYMAPEVWRQEFADHASDVWSLGATLYMLATGTPPFVGRSIPEIAFRVLTNAASEPLHAHRTDLPEALCALVDKALSKARAKRFASATEMLSALERISREANRPRALEGSPYPGLRAMTASDRDRFFGRDDDVVRVVERLRGESLVVLVGPSGAGKSSLAAAGVAPAVAGGALGEFPEWEVVRIAPGSTPLLTLAHAVALLLKGDGDALAVEMREAPDALARALRSFVQQRSRGVLVLLDQLEEMVTLADAADRDLVSAALGRLVSLSPTGVRVLATARSDLFDRLATLGSLGGQLGRATELVRPLSGAALREAIEEPARVAGARFQDPAIVEGIVRDVGAGEGALPLVAFAMRAWWDLRDRTTQTLTVAAWTAVGGVMGALGGHAEAVFQGLTTGDRTIARTVFQRVCAPDGTRRYATRRELKASVGDGEALARVLAAFVRERLLLSEGDGDEAQVTLGHEALSRSWRRMTHWRREGREDRALHDRVRAAADVWKASGESNELLWRGALLDEVIRWRVLYDDTLSPLERLFADASLRERSRGRWRTRFALALGMASLGAAGGLQWRTAQHDRGNTIAALHAQSVRDAAARAEDLALAWREIDPGIALAYLAHSVQLRGSATDGMRTEALALESRGAAMRYDCTADPATRRDGSVVACPEASRIRMIDVMSGATSMLESPADIQRVALADEANTVAWIDASGTLWRSDDARAPERWMDGVSTLSVLALSPSGREAAVFERSTGHLVWLDRAGLGGRTLGFDALPMPMRTSVGLAVRQHAVMIVGRADSGVEVRRFDATERPLGDARPVVTHVLHPRAMTREGARLAVIEDDSRIRLIDLDTGIEDPCVASAPGTISIALSRNAPERVAWLARPINAGAQIGVATIGTCAPVLTEAGPTDTIAFTDDGALALLSARLPMVLLDPTTMRLGSTIGPSIPSGVFESPIAVRGSTFLLPGGPLGRAVWRGPTPWTDSLGLRGRIVRNAAISADGQHVVVLDDSQRAWLFAGPSTPNAPSWRWHDVSDPTAVMRADALDDVHVTTLGHGAVAVVAAGLGAFVLEAPDGHIAWRASQPLASAANANGSYAILALEDGSGERIDLNARVRSSGPLLEGPATNVAIDANGRTAVASGEHGPAIWRDLSRSDWPAIPMRAFHELEDADALGVDGDRVVIAASRLGFATMGATAFVDAPAPYFASNVTSMHFDPAGAAYLTNDACEAWIASCATMDCRIARLSEPRIACTLATVDHQVWLAGGHVRILTVFDRTRGEVGTIALGERREGSPPVAEDVDHEAILVAGPPSDPWLRRIPLPPAEPAAFVAWVARRTNVVIDANEIPVTMRH